MKFLTEAEFQNLTEHERNEYQAWVHLQWIEMEAEDNAINEMKDKNTQPDTEFTVKHGE